jgi:ABC-2 type transport system ATP-binding protein
VRHHVGYLPETVPLYTDMTPLDYLDYMAKLKGMRDGKARKQRIWDVMGQVRIDDVAHKLIGRLSKGYRQRVGLAQALINNPDVLILDEPTVGLDPRQIIEVRELIKELGQSHTVILSTHILPEVSMTCTRVVIINRGRIAALDTPIHLAQDATGGVTRVQVTVRGPYDNVQQALQAIPGVSSVAAPAHSAFETLPTAQLGTPATGDAVVFEVVSEPGTDLRPRIAATVVNQNWELLDMHAVALSLEEIFLRVTTTEEAEEVQPDEAEYFEPGEEDDMTESEQEELYAEIAEEAAAEAELVEEELVDGVEEEIEESPPPARAERGPARPPVRGKGGRR